MDVFFGYVMSHKEFFKLKNIPKPMKVEEFSLDTAVLENEMVQNNGGIELKKLGKDCLFYIHGDDDFLKKFVPYFQIFDTPKLKEMADKYNISKPCSMALDSLEELSEHMATGYQVAHFHYILGKKHHLKSSFPSMCCGISSMNVSMSLMSLGYPNAAYAFSTHYDHAYVILPFVLNDGETKGTIIIDPTYDQLWKNKSERNAVFLRLGDKWEYKTEWKNGGNLFPDRIFSIDVIKSNPKISFMDYDEYPFNATMGQYFFQRAFENPIKLNEIQR